jgi:hypothetical protein
MKLLTKDLLTNSSHSFKEFKITIKNLTFEDDRETDKMLIYKNSKKEQKEAIK